MNRFCYRVIFSKSLGRLVVVSEKTRSAGKSDNSSMGGSMPAESSPVGFGLKNLSLSLLLSLGLAAHANTPTTIIADHSADKALQPIILNTASGITSVNIATPNDKGLSNNHYSQFDVGSTGAVLNNNRQAVNTQIAGFVAANPFMARGEASTILNQINSNHPSHLGGFIEVAGKKADVIIANPSGLVINGAGFINAGNVHLAAANSQVHQGQLTGYEVGVGNIAVNGKLNLQNTDYTALIAKTAQINDEIYAGNTLDVILGENQVSLQNGDFTKLNATNKQTSASSASQTTNKEQQGVALDISSLGGMYAGKIHLVGTDKGFGVNNAGVITATGKGVQVGFGTLTLDAQGNLINTGILSAKDKLAVNTHNHSVQNDGTLLSEQADLTINTKDLESAGTIHSTQTTQIDAANTLNNQGNLYGGVLQITTNTLTNTGKLVQTGTGSLNIGTDTLTNSNKAVIGQSLYEQTTLDIPSTPSSAQSAGTIGSDSKGNTTANTGNSSNTGTPATKDTTKSIPVPSADGFITANQSLTNTNDQALITATGDISITANQTKNTHQASIDAQTLNTKTLTNTDSKIALDDIHWQLTSFDNSKGDVSARSGMVIESGSDIVNMGGRLSANNAVALSAAGVLDNTQGVITGGGDLTAVSSDVVNHQGQILSDQSITIDTKDFSNQGKIIAKTVAIQAQTDIHHDKNDTLKAQNLSVTTKGRITNNDQLVAGTQITLQATNIDNANTATIFAPKALLHADNTITNLGLVHANDLNVQANTVKNLGARIYGNDVAITADTLLNQGGDKGAVIASQNTLNIAVDTLTNTHGETIHQTAADNAWILSQGMLSIHGKDGKNFKANQLTNLGSRIESTGELALSAKNIDNTNAYFASEIQKIAGSDQDKEYIIPEHSSTKIDMASLEWKPWSRAGYLSYKNAGDLTVNLDNLGSAPIASVYGCQNTDDESSCGINYAPDSIVWNHFGVKAPSPMPVIDLVLEEPILPQGETAESCTNADTANTACTAYNQALTEYNKALEPLTQWEETNKPLLDALDEAISAYNAQFGRPEYRSFTLFKVTEHQEQSVVTASAPAQMIAGGSLSFNADAIINDKSQMVAGGKITFESDSLTNIDAKGEHHTIEDGTSQYTHPRWRGGLKRYHQRDWATEAPFTTTKKQSITLPVTVWQENASNSTLADYGQAKPATGTVTTDANLGNLPDTNVANTAPISLPNSALYIINADDPNLPIVQTDPAFTNHKQWLGSDYMLKAIQSDPNHIHKRLYDGYAEQKIIQDAYHQLTGRHINADYANTQDGYKTLMDSGITFAKQYQLSPGIALTPAQMASLTTDMVWLVKQTVIHKTTDTNGNPIELTYEALVPQIYLRASTANTNSLSVDGRLSGISGKDIDLRIKNNLDNEANLIAKDSLSAQANHITNKGVIAGDFVSLQANQNIINNKQIYAGSTAQMTAGNDIINESLINSHTQDHTGHSSTTVIDQIASVTVGDGLKDAKDEHGNPLTTLSIQAGNYVRYAAGESHNAGGNTQIVAQHGIELDTVTTTKTVHAIADESNYFKESQSRDVGSNITSLGNLTLATTGKDADINIKGSHLDSATGTTAIVATGDIDVTEGRSVQSMDAASLIINKNLVSKKTRQTTYQANSDTSIQSSIGGGHVVMKAGGDMQIVATDVLANKDILLASGGDMTIASADNTQSSQSHTLTKKSGLFSTSPASITLGKQRTQNDNATKQTTHTGSTIGALDGNITMISGNSLNITNSEVIAQSAKDSTNATPTQAGNIHIQATDVVIESQNNQGSNESHFYQKTTGITASISSSVASDVQSIETLKDAINDTDSRKAQLMGSLAAVSKARTIAQNLQDGKLGSVRVQATIGSQSTKSDSHSYQETNDAANVHADGNLTFDVKGKGENSTLTVTGSNISVGKDLYNQVEGDVTYQAATQSSTSDSKNSSKGVGFGVYASGSLSTDGLSSNAAGFTANANRAKGSSQETTITHTNSQVTVKGTTHNDIGGNLTLDGANLDTTYLTGTVGGDLIVKSRQDSYQYTHDQKQAGGSLDVSFQGVPQSASINAGKTDIDASYKQVTQQSGITAKESTLSVQGQGKFTGGYLITDAGKNQTQFAQGIQTQDIENHLNYEGDAISVGVGIGADTSNPNGKAKPALQGLGYGTIDPVNKTSTTHSAITDQAGLSHINTENFNQPEVQDELNQILTNDFDKEQALRELGSQVNITTEFGKEAPKAVAEFSQYQQDAILSQLQNIEHLSDEQINEILSEAAKWGEGGIYRVALHTAVGAIGTGTVEGALTTGGIAAAAPTINKLSEQITEQLLKAGISEDTAQNATSLITSLAIATATQSAGVDTSSTTMAVNADAFNRQLHPDEIRFILDEDRVKEFAEKYGLSIEEAETELIRVAAAYKGKDWATIYDLQSYDTDGKYKSGDPAPRALTYIWSKLNHEEQKAFDHNDEYYDPKINLRKLFDKIEDVKIQRAVEILYVPVHPQVAQSDFILGGQLGASQANMEASLKNDLQSLIPDPQSIFQYIKNSLISDEVGAYDDQLMQNYYENLLRIQGKYKDLGYIQGKNWNETQRLIGVSGIILPLSGASSSIVRITTSKTATQESGTRIENNVNFEYGDYVLPTGRQVIDPTRTSFSQATVSYQKRNADYNYDSIVTAMKEKQGWVGDPVDVVNMPDKAPTSIDNTRILAAREAGVKVEAIVHNFDDPIPLERAEKLMYQGKIPKTWGEAIQLRVQKQSEIDSETKEWPSQYPNGSIYDPKITYDCKKVKVGNQETQICKPKK